MARDAGRRRSGAMTGPVTWEWLFLAAVGVVAFAVARWGGRRAGGSAALAPVRVRADQGDRRP